MESLGKELGLEVPPDVPYSENKESGTGTSKEIKTAHKGEKDTLRVGNNRPSTVDAVTGSLMVPEVAPATICHEKIIQDGSSIDKQETADSINAHRNGSRKKSGNKNSNENVTKEGRKTESPARRPQNWSNGISEDERSRKRSRHRHRNNSDSETSDSFDDSQRYSKSKEKRKRSSREKSSSRRHSKHHKHRYGDSPERDSRYGSRKVKDRR